MFAYANASKTFGSNLIFLVVIAQFWLLLDVEGGLRTGQLWRVHTYCVGLTFVRCRGVDSAPNNCGACNLGAMSAFLEYDDIPNAMALDGRPYVLSGTAKDVCES